MSPPPLSIGWRSGAGAGEGRGPEVPFCPLPSPLGGTDAEENGGSGENGEKEGTPGLGGGVQRGLRRSGASRHSQVSPSAIYPIPLPPTWNPRPSLSLIPSSPLPPSHCSPLSPSSPLAPTPNYLPLLPSFHIVPPSLPQDLHPPSPLLPPALHSLRMALTVSPSPLSIAALNTQLLWGRPQVGPH